jgi:8-oxo-dGTP pyrophosphatase MutT (NUDIX family)
MTDALLRQLMTQSGPKLTPKDAVAAILVRDDGRYVMQLRDSIPEIFYPGHWGCFGGAVEAGEDPADAMRRELEEELEFTVRDLQRFTRFEFDFAALGQPKAYRLYFEIAVDDDAFGRLVLHEGADVKAFDGRRLLAGKRVTPYDAFAIWMHLYSRRERRTEGR